MSVVIFVEYSLFSSSHRGQAVWDPAWTGFIGFRWFMQALGSVLAGTKVTFCKAHI